jgi:hypothetical protein
MGAQIQMLDSQFTYSEIAGENFSQNQARMMSNQKTRSWATDFK